MEPFTPVQLTPRESDAATKPDGKDRIIVDLAPTPSETWIEAFLHFERKKSVYDEENVATIEGGPLTVWTSLNDLRHRWDELVQAAEYANKQTRLRVDNENAEQERKAREQAAHNARLHKALASLPKHEPKRT